MVIVARYNEEHHFKIPIGVDLDDKTQVRKWGMKWNKLWIEYIDGREEDIDSYIEFEVDYKNPDWCEQEDLDGSGGNEDDFDEEIEEYRDALEAKKEPFFFNLAIKKVKRSKIFNLGLAMKIDMMRCGLLLEKM
ncbi:hypothetical protein [Chrysochromulina parva virophage Larry]|nr:hypothetical protein [Chrysochromulina parva virophage Larry]